MASQKTKFAVGLFAACGIGIGLVAFVWLGMSRYLQEGQYYVTYFNESVQGLNQDSPVKYRGVAIGRVESIAVAPDADLIEVVLKIESGQSLQPDIVAQLKAVGITGSVFIELDRRQEGEADRSPAVRFPSRHPVVASKPAEISELLKGVDDVLNQLRSLDVAGISDKLKQTLDHINQTIAEARIKELSGRLESSLKGADRILDEERWERIGNSLEEVSRTAVDALTQARKSLNRLEGTLKGVETLTAEVAGPIRQAADNLKQATEEAKALMSRGGTLVENTDASLAELRRQFLGVAHSLQTAGENLNRLLEQVEEQPSSILFGRPRPARQVESGR